MPPPGSPVPRSEVWRSAASVILVLLIAMLGGVRWGKLSVVKLLSPGPSGLLTFIARLETVWYGVRGLVEELRFNRVICKTISGVLPYVQYTVFPYELLS